MIVAVGFVFGGTEIVVGDTEMVNTGLAQHARIALVNGSVGLIVVLRRQLRVALSLTIENDKLTEIDVIADPARLRVTTLAVLEEA